MQLHIAACPASLLYLQVCLQGTQGVQLADILPQTTQPATIGLSSLRALTHVLGDFQHQQLPFLQAAGLFQLAEAGQGQTELTFQPNLYGEWQEEGVIGVTCSQSGIIPSPHLLHSLIQKEKKNAFSFYPQFLFLLVFSFQPFFYALLVLQIDVASNLLLPRQSQRQDPTLWYRQIKYHEYLPFPSSSQAILSLQICIPPATSRPIIFTIIVTMSRVTDLTIENIIRKYEHRQQVLRSDLDAQDTARPRGDVPLGSGMSTPEFSFTIGRTEINKKLEDQERIQRTQKKQEGRMKEEEESFSTDRETLLRQLEQTQERLARSQRNFAEASRKCDQLQRREREMELNGRLKGKTYEQLEGKVAALQRENANYKECIASKDTNITVLREKLKEKNERLIECERIVSELKSQLAASNAAGQHAKDQEQERQREKEALVERLRNELTTLQKVAGDREAQRKELLAEIEKSYRNHQEELQVIRKSYVQVEEEYQQWIDNCNAEKLVIIKEYQQKLIQARGAITPNKPLTAFEDEIQRRERQSARLIALTALQSSDIKQLRSELQASERMKAELVHKVSSLENSLIDKTEALSSMEAAYSSLLQQLKEEEERTCQLRQRYNGVNKQFVELRGKFGVLFQSLEATKRDGHGEGAELVRVRKELVACREQLERSRGNEMALNAKLADATRAIKDRLAKAQQQREENLTQLMAERLQNARLQEQLQETKQYLKRQYDLSLENTRKELQQQIHSGSKTTRSNIDPEKQQLYLQLRALQRKYELLAHQIVTVDEVMDIANKVKRRHEPSKKSLHA